MMQLYDQPASTRTDSVHAASQSAAQEAYHGLLPVAVPHPLVALGLILGLHPSLALLLGLIILLVGLLCSELCLLPV